MLILGASCKSDETYEIEVAKPKVKPLLAQFDNNLELLCCYLRILGSKMVLLNPVS